MDLKVEGHTLRFSGVLDETTDMEQARQAIIALGASQGPEVYLDLSEVRRANSCGILSWLRLLRDVNLSFVYVNAPVWLIAQFNMISEFFVGRVRVESIQAPFYCPADDSSLSLTLFVGEDIPVRDDYEDFQFANRAIDGKEYEPDFDPAEYFSFIAANFQRFGSAA